MDLTRVMAVFRPGENVAPDLSSWEAMAFKWRGSGSCPTKMECQAKWAEIVAADNASKYLEERKLEYHKRGLTVEALVEAIIEHLKENRPEKLEELQAIRMDVKQDIPKPAEPK